MNDTATEIPAQGFECPACGCRHLYVTGTRIVFGGRKRRRRECRHCGRIVYTLEKIVESKPAPVESPPVLEPQPVCEPAPVASADAGPEAGIFPPGFFDAKPKAHGPRKGGAKRKDAATK